MFHKSQSEEKAKTRVIPGMRPFYLISLILKVVHLIGLKDILIGGSHNQTDTREEDPKLYFIHIE
jgi:hypothetical protein